MYVQEHKVVLLRRLAQEIKILPNEFSSLFPGALPDTQIVFVFFPAFFSFLIAGRCANSAVVPIPTASLRVCCCCHHLLLCGGVLLVCAEGCTQVTGVMAVRMTGRVLLVCALCVLWCGAGGVYAKDLDNKALGGCMASGVLGAKTSYVPNGCNKYMPTPPLRSALPIPAIQAEVVNLGDVSRDGIKLSSDSAPGSGPGGGGGGKGSPAPVPGVSGPAGPPVGVPAVGVPGPAAPGVSGVSGPGGSPAPVPGVPGSAGPGGVAGGEVDSLVPSSEELPSQNDDTVAKSSDLSTTHSGSREEVLQQKATETHKPSPSNERTQESLSDVQQQQISTSENIKKDCGPEASNCESDQSVGKTTMEKQDSEESKAQKPPPAQHKESKDNEENSTEASSQESQNTEPQQEIKTPVDESDTTSTDASTAVAARSTSAGSQEEATESSSNGSHSPLQGEVFTGTDAPENASSPGAAETEKRQGENVTKDGDSDGSTAVSHTTSPLLLLLVACAAAAAVVAA
ncbi:Mucin-associated surface protein (MASP) [Trypanosoma cruzi]|uniref:Mucin-associated surface protein (MASP) n=1 Tax=Trypanosoma cruzi TaxID=5693 RepID=A0A2V2VVH5_TRYCR|nr:Mucin-associated surface protein (MASP) [Trypanosoma cruzi]